MISISGTYQASIQTWVCIPGTHARSQFCRVYQWSQNCREGGGESRSLLTRWTDELRAQWEILPQKIGGKCLRKRPISALVITQTQTGTQKMVWPGAAHLSWNIDYESQHFGDENGLAALEKRSNHKVKGWFYNLENYSQGSDNPLIDSDRYPKFMRTREHYKKLSLPSSQTSKYAWQGNPEACDIWGPIRQEC